jgi:hypothetical protein
MKRIILLLIVTITIDCFAQKAQTAIEINKKIEFELFGKRTPDITKLKDSADFYGFAIALQVSLKNGYTVVNAINVNDSIAYKMYKNFDVLKEINYVSLLQGRKQATIIIPIGFVIAYVNYPTSTVPVLKAEGLMEKIIKMFNKDYKTANNLSDFIYLDPIMCLCGTKIYN